MRNRRIHHFFSRLVVDSRFFRKLWMRSSFSHFSFMILNLVFNLRLNISKILWYFSLSLTLKRNIGLNWLRLLLVMCHISTNILSAFTFLPWTILLFLRRCIGQDCPSALSKSLLFISLLPVSSLFSFNFLLSLLNRHFIVVLIVFFVPISVYLFLRRWPAVGHRYVIGPWVCIFHWWIFLNMFGTSVCIRWRLLRECVRRKLLLMIVSLGW